MIVRTDAAIVNNLNDIIYDLQPEETGPGSGRCPYRKLKVLVLYTFTPINYHFFSYFTALVQCPNNLCYCPGRGNVHFFFVIYLKIGSMLESKR